MSGIAGLFVDGEDGGLRDERCSAMERALGGAAPWTGDETVRVTIDAERVDAAGVAAAYERAGARGVAEQLEGDCSAAVWDAGRRELHLVCDRLGTRPLYYVARASGFAFASRLRALAPSGLCLPKIDEEAVWGYLLYGHMTGARTALAGVLRVPAGHVLTWSRATGAVRVERYWDYPARDVRAGVLRDEATAELDARASSVVERVAGGGATRCFLSGGPGSALVAAAAARAGVSFETAHLALPGADAEAARRAVEVAAALGVRHTTVEIDMAGLPARVEAFLDELDEPLGDPTAFVTRTLAAETSGNAVAVGGGGAAELFAAHARYRRFVEPLEPDPYTDRIARLEARIAVRRSIGGGFPAPDASVRSPRTGYRYLAQPEFLLCLLDLDRRPSVDTFRRELAAIEERRLAETSGLTPLARALVIDAKLWLEHAVAARAGARAPLLDSSIVELAFRLSDDVRMSVLSEAHAPVGAGRVLQALVDCSSGAMRTSSLVDEGILSADGLRAVVAAHREGAGLARLIWSLAALDRWWWQVRAEIRRALPADGAIPRLAPGREPTVDVLIPVYEGFNYVRDCVRSVQAFTERPFRALLLDDASCDATVARLEALVAGDERFSVVRNERNLGFVGNCNRGFAMSDADYVVLLNSDTIVAPGWLERMVACAESDPSIAVVNPLTNESGNTSIRMAPGLTVLTMARRIAEVSRRDYPDLTTGVGMCMLIRRSALELLGGFDPVFAPAYCEESDLCMRFTEAGLRVVAADDAFIYHKGSTSYETVKKNTYYERNRKVFDARWAVAYERDWAGFVRRDPLGYVRSRLLRGALTLDEATPRARAAVDAHLARLDTPRALDAAADGQRASAAAVLLASRAPHGTERARFRAIAEARALRPPLAFHERRVFHPTREYVASLPPAGPGKLRITFLVTGLGLSGGMLSILGIAREMMLAGHDVRFVTEANEILPEALNLWCQPLVYRDREHLVEAFPESDVVVATFWVTAHRYLRRLHRRYHFTSVYFIQDYEAWFYPETELEHRRNAIRSYEDAEHHVVMSQWMADMVGRHGTACDIVHLGLDLGVYYPRGNRSARPRVVSVAAPRPEARRRGFAETAECFRLVHEARPDVELVLFGTAPSDMPALPFAYTNAGRIHEPNKVAALLSSATVLLDASLWQGFGRPGLEAMACRTAPVLTNVGGLGEYARDEENALLVPPRDPQAAAAAILRLLDDPALCDRLAAEGLETSRRFSHEVETQRHLELYGRWVHEKRLAKNRLR